MHRCKIEDISKFENQWEALQCVFQCFFDSVFFIRFAMTSNIFLSCLKIGSTVNDAPITNSMYLKVFFCATLCFSLLFWVNFFIRFIMMTNIFSSCLMISSTVNDAPISNLRYLKVFRRYAVFFRVFFSQFYCFVLQWCPTFFQAA